MELEGRDDIYLHNGLKNDGFSSGEGILERSLGSETEGEFRGIDLVRRAVLENELAPADWVAGEDTTLESVVESLGTS